MKKDGLTNREYKILDKTLDELYPNQKEVKKMSLGTGPDIPSYDKEREKEVKLGDEVMTWWFNLDESEKLDVLEAIYPDQVGFIDSDELWNRTSWNDQLEAYKDANGYNRIEL